MRNFIIVIAIVLITKGLVFTQHFEWKIIYIFPQPYRINVVTFSDSVNGWAGGLKYGTPDGVNGVVLKTNNGGISWSEQALTTGYSWINSIDFNNSIYGWAGGLNCLYKTSDGGSEWYRVPDSLFDFGIYTGLSDIQSVSSYDSTWGIITGTESTVAVTHNGGQSWDCATIIPVNGWIDTVYFGKILSSDRICVTGNGGVAISTDSGQTWMVTHDEYRSYVKCFFLENGNGWTLSRDSQILHTGDYGENWSVRAQIFNDDSKSAVDIAFTDSSNGWVLTNYGVIFNTYDGGFSWTSDTISLDTALVSITKSNGSGIYVLNEVNHLYRHKTVSSISSAKGKIPKVFKLDDNYPNPFNSSTRITYLIPEKTPVKIQIIDIQGRIIKTLVNRVQEMGLHQVNWYAGEEPSGVYFYRLIAGDFTETRKCLLIK
jgi:photosystem II stability/assembly factor-like uncharacterized protein